MQINFFDSEFQIRVNNLLFGLCDDLDETIKTPAYIDFDNEDNWIATVLNSSPSKEIIFTAIDHGIIKYNKDIDNPKKCDVMLHFYDTIIFVELKNKEKKPAQIKQLEKTIELFCNNHDLNIFQSRKAYLSNKKKTVVLSQDTKDKFKEDNQNFRLYFSTDIKI